MRKKILLYLLQILFTAGSIYSQKGSVSVSGRVTGENGEPLAGTGVIIINTSQGTYSDKDGYYTLSLKNPGTFKVRYSYTGYKTITREIEVTDHLHVDVVLYTETVMAEEIIVSATRAGTKTPVAFTIVDRDDLMRNNTGKDMPYLLALTPSLVETSESGTGIGYTNLRIRGTDANRINITVDGIPINDAESQQVFWVDLPDLASSVNNIQVQRGVGTSSNGAGAFGASINIQTKMPDNEPFTQISTSYGSYNSFRNMITAGTGLISGHYSLQLRYSDLRSDGYIKRTGTDNRSGAFTGLYRNNNSMLKLNIILGEEHTGISWWGVPSDILGTDRRYNPAGEYTDENGNTRYYDNESDNYRQDHYQLIFSNKIGKYLNLNTALHYTNGKGYYEEFREEQDYSDYNLPPVSGDTSLITSTDLIRRKWMANDFYGLVYSLRYVKGGIDAVLGGGANTYYGEHYGKIIWMRQAGNTEKDHRWYHNKATKSEVSLYGKVNYKFSDLVSGFADIQYRHIGYSLEGPDDDQRDLTQSHNFDFLNPKAGIFLTITPSQDAFISFSVANREPARSDFKEAAGDPDAMPRPETLFDTEAGYRIQSGKLSFEANLYCMIYRNQLIPTGELSDVGYPVMTNVGKSSRMGIELTSSWKPASSLRWNGAVTLSRNRIKDFTGYHTVYNTVDWNFVYQSRNYGDVSLAYSPSLIIINDFEVSLGRKIEMHLTTKHVGKQYFDNTMSRNRMLDPYTVSNLGLMFNSGGGRIKDFEAAFFINNLFNAKYISNGYGGLWYEDDTEKTWAYYFPQAGINFTGRLTFTF